MSVIRNKLRLKEKMKQLLIGAGTIGVQHSALIQKCRTKIYTAAEVRKILEDWEARLLVQAFMVDMPHSNKPVKVWRATTLIMEERL